MTQKDEAGVRATVDAWLAGWTFDPSHLWSLDRFTPILHEDAQVIDDYGHQLSILNGHKDYASIWGPMVKQYMKQWAIKCEEETYKAWVGDTVACVSFVLRGGGEMANGEVHKLRQYCTFPLEKIDGRWVILKEHITTDFDYST